MDDLQREFLEYLNSKNKLERKLITEQIHSHYKFKTGLFVKVIRQIPFEIAFLLQNAAIFAALSIESIIWKSFFVVLIALSAWATYVIPIQGFIWSCDKPNFRIRELKLGIGLATPALIFALISPSQSAYPLMVLMASGLALIAISCAIYHQKTSSLKPLIGCFCLLIALSELSVTGIIFSWIYLTIAFAALVTAQIISLKIFTGLLRRN